MKLVAGLGNPGRKYRGTRHNIGWDVLAEVARRFANGKPREKFNGEIIEADIRGEKIVLLSPLTYMNRSGGCVQPARDFYKLENSEVLIVCDDFNLPAARLRVRMKGSAGGQKGLQDVIQRLGTQEVARLRIGIGQPPPGWEISSYVLSKFTDEEKGPMEEAVRRACEAVETWVTEGIEACMNRFNAGPADPDNKRKDSSSEKTAPADKRNKPRLDGSAKSTPLAETPIEDQQKPSSGESGE